MSVRPVRPSQPSLPGSPLSLSSTKRDSSSKLSLLAIPMRDMLWDVGRERQRRISKQYVYVLWRVHSDRSSYDFGRPHLRNQLELECCLVVGPRVCSYLKRISTTIHKAWMDSTDPCVSHGELAGPEILFPSSRRSDRLSEDQQTATLSARRSHLLLVRRKLEQPGQKIIYGGDTQRRRRHGRVRIR